MKRKTVSFVLFGLVTVVLASLSIALYVIDWNQYRGTLASLASERLGVQVELAGNLRLAFLPRPAVSAELVRLTPGRDGYNDAIATADRIDMSLGLSALLGGNFELQSLAFEGLSASLVETESGWSLEGWPQTGQPEGDAGPTLLSLDRFRVNSGAILVHPVAGHEIVIEGLNLDLSGALPSGPLDWNGSAIVLGQPINVSGRVMPTRTAGATSVKASLSVNEAIADFSGRVSENGEVHGRFQSEGQSLKAFIAFLQSLNGMSDTGTLPDLPYHLDIQVDRDARGVSRLVSRQARLDQTRGAIDLTLAESETALHVAGTVSFGVVPLDAWLAAISDEQSVNDKPSPGGGVAGLSGGIDLSVETVEFRDSQIQQVSAVIGLSDTGASVNQLTALLPGASRFSFQRDGAAGGGMRFQSGGLQDVLRWAGVPLSEQIPAGRLRTADLRASLSVTENAWIVSDVTGTLDTSKLDAEISGTISPFALNAAQVAMDTLNLDAYWPDASLEASGNLERASSLPTVQFAFDIGRLHWLSQDFTNVSTAGSAAEGGIAIQSLTANQMDGYVQGSAEVQLAENKIVDASVALEIANWRFPIISKLYADVGSAVNLFSGNEPVTGSLTLDGPPSALQSRVVLASSQGSMDVSGTLSSEETWQGRLQGSVAHPQLGVLLARARVWPDGNRFQLPARANITFEGDADDFSFSISGDMAGAQLSTTGSRSADVVSADVSVTASAGQSTGLDPVIAAYGYVPDTNEIRRMRAQVSVGDGQWAVSGMDIRNGVVALTGELVNAADGLSGNIALSNFAVSRLADQRLGGDGTSVKIGRIQVALDNVTGFGQMLSAPSAVVAGGNDGLTFVAGQGATLNGDTLEVSIDLADSDGALNTELKAGKIDIGRFASAFGASAGFSGSVQADLNLSAKNGPGAPFISTLTGQGSFEGGAGVLHFMAVPELISAIRNGDSATAFLQSIGGMLRNGTTEFASINGSFQVDNGVALVDELRAAGSWGHLELDGQLNILRDYINMSGELALSQLQDAPVIPVSYEGALANPNVNWTSRALERFAIAGIERRIRTTLFGEFEQAQSGQGENAAPNPGAFVSGIAAGLLSRLKERQEARRRAEEAAKADSEPSGSSSQ